DMTHFYVTTPIYYVNDKPHIGHAYTTILADVLTRYHRLLGAPSWFLTGTDEHGQKVQKAADAAGISPLEQADRTVVRFQDLWKKLEITHDDFIRTTEPRHKKVVQAALADLHARGEIYRAEYDGWYCTPCERFYMEKDLAEGNCPECNRPVEKIREANYFFRMSRYQEWLIRYIEEHPDFIRPDFRRNETLGFLRKPLNDLCISRPKSRMGWGIELPFDSEFVCYVWFDALVNYISAVGYGREPTRFKQRWPASVHLIGKDILTTHTVYWPTMLQALGLPQPECVFAHGWWLMGDTKMSKSLGNVINPMDLIDRCGVDAFRYFLMAEMTLGQDASFTEDAFVRRLNADLANDLGNLLSRLLKMLASGCSGRFPSIPDALSGGAESALWAQAQSAVDSLEPLLKNFRTDQILSGAMAVVKATNRYLEEKQPWTLAKAEDRGPLERTLGTATEALRVAAGLLEPVMPGKMGDLRRALGLVHPPDLSSLRTFGVIPAGTPLEPGLPLFPRAERVSAAIPVPAAPPVAPVSKPPPEAGPAEITYDDFARVDLRVATVLAAERVEKADKLLKLQIEIAGEPRQIIAGVAQHATPEELIGKKILVVANLKPAKIRGVESRGMLLAASDTDGKLRVVTLDAAVPSGTKVK
ncbi:MAG: methionine--tRNA ligase, partial [Kiritimatiellia bacterium]|nr:methionine--tRNA ligase [Kiritimatiellia bacterium]